MHVNDRPYNINLRIVLNYKPECHKVKADHELNLAYPGPFDIIRPMTHKEKALYYFSEKFHCSQAVLAAFASETGLTEEQALRLGGCFGSGMRKGEVCGACTGALMVIGLMYGQFDKEDLESRLKTNNATDEFMKGFAEKSGSYICNELLGCDLKTDEGIRFARENNLFTEFCPKMVANAVDVLEEILRNNGEKA